MRAAAFGLAAGGTARLTTALAGTGLAAGLLAGAFFATALAGLAVTAGFLVTLTALVLVLVLADAAMVFLARVDVAAARFWSVFFAVFATFLPALLLARVAAADVFFRVLAAPALAAFFFTAFALAAAFLAVGRAFRAAALALPARAVAPFLLFRDVFAMTDPLGFLDTEP